MRHTALKAWTFITSLIIIIGYGHGVVPIVFVEFPYPLAFRKIDLASEYRYLIYPSVIFFMGHILFAVFAFVRKLLILWSSLIALWIGLMLLIAEIFVGDSIGAFAFLSGIPFIILSILLFRASLSTQE
ncbi:MAG TPA: hypothetical protein VL442_11910 [Mucilaginibacter sp.]|jgi:hypothetical protein|nr:hypothetical protein [Mucilaginibacter sp.]